MSNLTSAELRAVAYYAIGVASEGGDVAYKLSIAANRSTGQNGDVLLKPIGNSGYTIGVMQIDLGARPEEAQKLIDNLQSWARKEKPDWVMTAAEAAMATADLARNGRKIRDPDYVANNEAYKKLNAGREIPSNLLPEAGLDIDPVLKARLNQFLASDSGKSFVHALDLNQVGVLLSMVAEPLKESPLYKESSPEDQAKLFGMVAKAYNQGPFYAKPLLDDIKKGCLNTVDEVKERIGTLPTYMVTGRDHALKGVDLFNALRSASKDNSMHAPWQAVIANPLIDPTQVRNDPSQPHLGQQYDTVKGIFVQPDQGLRFVQALQEEGIRSYGDHRGKNSRGFHVAGKNFVHWDRSGEGRAFVDGQWTEFSRSELSRARHKDNSYELQLTQGEQKVPLFHGGKATPRIVDAQPEAAAQKTSQVLLDNPLHAGHALYRQAHEGMRRIDAGMGRTPDRFTDNAAACVAVAACRAGLTKIDHMGMAETGRNVWVVQGRMDSVFDKIAGAPVQSFSTPIEQTSAEWESAHRQAESDRQLAQQRLAAYRRIDPLQSDPVQSAPAMQM